MVVIPSSQGTPPLGGVGHPLSPLISHIRLVRGLLYSVCVAADVPKIRDDLIDALVGAIQETNKLAKESNANVEKGAGGVPPKARWYQLLGYLTQVLDGVCKNVELSEINERLLLVEKELKIAQGKSPQTRRTA
jgi:hypothetical protein